MPAQSVSDSVVDSSTQPDYSAVDIPSKDRRAYSYVERRAELLQLIREVGEPKALNQTELADRYGVCQQQISKDLTRLAAYTRERMIDRDRRAFVVEHVVRRSIRGLLDTEEYRKAAKTAMEYDDWLTEFHDMEQLDARLDALEQDAGHGRESRL